MSFCSIINGCVSEGRVSCFNCNFNFCDEHIYSHHCAKSRKLDTNDAFQNAIVGDSSFQYQNEPSIAAAGQPAMPNNHTDNISSSSKPNPNQCFENEVAPSDCWKYLLTQKFSKQQINSIIAITLCTHCFMVDTTEMIPILQNTMPHIQDVLHKFISKKNLSQMSKEAAKRSDFLEIKSLGRSEDRRCIFEGALVVLLLFQQDLLMKYNIVLYQSVEQMLHVYPEFQTLDSVEIEKLLDFCNFMKLGLMLQPAKGHKGHLLDLITKLTEGRTAKYICGGGQSSATSRRVQVYEREGGVTPVARPWRIPWSKIGDWVDQSSSSSFSSSAAGLNSTNLENNNSPQGILDALQQFDPDNLVNKTVTSLMLAPEMHLEAHELASADGLTIVRAMSLKRIIESHDGQILRTDELARSFSISHPSNSVDDEIWKDEHLLTVETGQMQKEGVSVSRQINNIQGQIVRGFSLSKQILPPPSDSDSDDNIDYKMDDELFDWLKSTSTSARSVSCFRQNSLSSYPRLPSVPVSNSFSLRSSRIGSALSLSNKSLGGTRQTEEINLPTEQDWQDLLKRNKNVQEVVKEKGKEQEGQVSGSSSATISVEGNNSSSSNSVSNSNNNGGS